MDTVTKTEGRATPWNKGRGSAYRRSIARRFLAVLVLRRLAAHPLGKVHRAGKILELEPGIVRAQAHGTSEISYLVAERTAPDYRTIGRNRQFIALQVCTQRMRVTGHNLRRLNRHRRFDIHVAMGAALFMGTLTRITLYRDRNARIRFDVPHD